MRPAPTSFTLPERFPVSMKPALLIARRLTAPVLADARRDFDIVESGPGDIDTAETVRLLRETGAPALVFSSNVRLDAATIAALPETLKIAATCSVGFDHIDVAAAARKGLPVTNTPGTLDECTADHAFMLLLAAARRARAYIAMVDAGGGRVLQLDEMLGLRVSGKVLGIVGMGRIGRAMAARARGFGMSVVYTGRTRLPPALEQGALFFEDFRAMLGAADFVSLHAPGGPTTNGMIDRAAIAGMRRGAVLINTARGSLIDEDALIEALQDGQLFAAGIDVWNDEPAVNPRLVALPNVIMTPHMASATRETRDAMGFRALANIRAVLSGRPPIDPLTTG